MKLIDLRKSPLFQGLSDEEIRQLMDSAERVSLRAGETLLRQGDLGDAAYVLLDGEFEVQKQAGQSVIKIGVRDPGDIVGEMALLRRSQRNATIIAKTDSEALRIPQEAFERLLSSNPGTALTVLHWVMDRLTQNEALLHQQEKMAALGTLSAGLAHELNNPAAAAQRSAAELAKTAPRWQALTHRIETLAFKEKSAEWFETFMADAWRQLLSPLKLDALEKIDREDRLQSWLEAQGIGPAWELGPALVSFGWDIEALERLKKALAQCGDLFELCIEWLAGASMMMGLLSDLQQTTARISQIVQAMKSYTYLDQAPLLEVDVHEGLENTLVIMQHKLKQGVTVVRDYAPGLPRIEAYASELNQVWTNLIDNAIDAMQGKGRIEIRTYAENEHIVVEVTDNGPGIPEEIQGRIYEPFFTTKPPGSGTGLGLHISHDIVTNRHHGQLTVQSKPGETTFRVVLPVKMGS
ncbi:MAG: sensor histidine kinase [Bacteroidota bacterium]